MERESITLPIGKTVDPIWRKEKKNTMLGIKIMPNMALSLLKNEVVSKQSVFQIKEIVLVTKYKKETIVPIKKVILAADGSYRCYVGDDVEINRGQLVLPRSRRRERH